MPVGVRTTDRSMPVPEVPRTSHAAVFEMGLLVLVHTLKTVVFFRWLFRSSQRTVEPGDRNSGLYLTAERAVEGAPHGFIRFSTPAYTSTI